MLCKGWLTAIFPFAFDAERLAHLALGPVAPDYVPGTELVRCFISPLFDFGDNLVCNLRCCDLSVTPACHYNGIRPACSQETNPMPFLISTFGSSFS